MAIRPPPRHYSCPACGWSKTVAPRSDALGPWDFYKICPKCSHHPVDSRATDAGAALGDLSQVARYIERLWKSLR